MSASRCFGHPLQARFGVSHGRRRIAINRAKISLPIDQRIAHGEILRQANHSVVDHGFAVRMILARKCRRRFWRTSYILVVMQAHLVHRVKNAAMHGLQSVANIGQRTPDDDHME